MATNRREATAFKTFTDPYGRGFEAGKDGSDKYDVEYLTFPLDLFGSVAEDGSVTGGPTKYGNSWTMININVLTSSAKADAYRYVDISDFEKKRFTEFDDRAKNGGSQQTNATAIAATAAAVGGISQYLKSGGDLKSGVSAALKGGGVAAFALAPILGGNVRTTKRISHAIQLPMPNQLTTNYSMQWGEESTKLLDLAMRLPGASFDAIKGAFTGDISALKGLGGQAADALYSQTLGAQSALGGGGVSAATGLASNPKKEMVFNGVNFRNFNLNYQFYPKSEQEAYNAYFIINQLKYHMHPEFKTSGRFTYIYPSEFDITFFTKDGEENTWVSRIATCVLTDLSVNYTPNGLWASHSSQGMYNGFPNMIEVNMAFRELSILTKETVEMGF